MKPRVIILLTLTLLGTSLADDRTSQNTPQMAEWLRQFPEADTNKDGILTWPEATAYKQKLDAAASVKPTFGDVRYGEHPRNVLDFYASPKAEAGKPAPVVIYFHGGGFVAGDKAKAAGSGVGSIALRNGIHLVSANYRFVKGENSEPFPGSLLDGVRVVQFVRSKAAEWNIDPAKVVLAGGSAGACMSIWTATHDDFAKPDSDDPIARQSSRVLGVISYGGQTTLDPFQILQEIGGNPTVHPSVYPIYGVENLEQLKTGDYPARIKAFSAVTHVTPDDPPMQLRYGGTLAGTPLPADTGINVSIHHAKFGDILRQAYTAAGAKAPIQIVCADGTDPAATEWEFLARVFTMPTNSSN